MISNVQTISGIRKFKITFLGDDSVGKSSIIDRFIYDSFDANHQPTIGIDFISKNLELDNQQVRLQLWDTATRTKRSRYLLPSYVKDSHAIVVCYDITSSWFIFTKGEESFSDVGIWIEQARAEKDDYKCLIYILGNKIDLENQRRVDTDAGLANALHMGVQFCEVSAKTSFNVSQFFNKLAFDLLIREKKEHQQQV